VGHIPPPLHFAARPRRIIRPHSHNPLNNRQYYLDLPNPRRRAPRSRDLTQLHRSRCAAGPRRRSRVPNRRQADRAHAPAQSRVYQGHHRRRHRVRQYGMQHCVDGSCGYDAAHSARCRCLGPEMPCVLLYGAVPATGAAAAALPSTMHARSRRHPTITTRHHHHTSLLRLLLLLYGVSQCVFLFRHLRIYCLYCFLLFPFCSCVAITFVFRSYTPHTPPIKTFHPRKRASL
jgi:hypothetical protein